jgi:hypothetical protein
MLDPMEPDTEQVERIGRVLARVTDLGPGGLA